MISKSFLKSSIIYTAGGALPMAASIILLPFYTNYLTDLQYTQVAFYISVSLLLQIIFSYSIESYFGIKYTQLSGEAGLQEKFLGTVSILLLAIGAFVLILCSCVGDYAFSKIFNPKFGMQFWPMGFWSVLTAFFNSYFKASTNALIYLKKPGLFLTANFVNFVVTLCISIGGLFVFPGTIAGPIYGRLFSGVIIFFIAQYIYSHYGKFEYGKEFVKDLTAFCTPYVFYVLCGWCLNFFDRYVLQPYIPATDLNAYDLVLKCFFGIEFLQNSLTAIIFPRLYEIWAKQNSFKTTKESNRYFNVFTAINIIQLILFCIFIPLLYKLLIHNRNFYEGERYIGILAAGYGLRSILYFYLSTILYSRNIKVLLKIFGISAIFQVTVTFFLIRWTGLIGAIYAGLAVKLLQVALSAQLTKTAFRYDFNFSKIIGVPLLYLVVNIVGFHVFPGYNIRLYIAQLLIFGIIFFVLFRNEIAGLYAQFFKKV